MNQLEPVVNQLEQARAATDSVRGIVRSAARFVVIGIANNAITYGGFVMLSLLGVGAIPALTMTYIVGLAITFLGNRRWTFNHGGRVPSAVFRFLCLSLSGYVLNLIILGIFVSSMKWPQIVVQFFAIAVVAVFSFTGMQLWVFRKMTRDRLR